MKEMKVAEEQWIEKQCDCIQKGLARSNSKQDFNTLKIHKKPRQTERKS